MASHSWKAEERRTCAALRMLRTPLSGRGGGAGTSGDCYTKDGSARAWIYAEIKHYARAFIFTLFKDTKDKAKREGKRPIVVLHKKGSTLRVAVVDFDFLCELLDRNDQDGNASLD